MNLETTLMVAQMGVDTALIALCFVMLVFGLGGLWANGAFGELYYSIKNHSRMTGVREEDDG